VQVSSAACTSPQATDVGRLHYLDYPPSKKLGGVKGRRPDWGNPFVAELLDRDVWASISACGKSWEALQNDNGDWRFRLTDYCHERLFCGICATSEAHERASTWLETFKAASQALGLKTLALYFVFTLSTDLSREIAAREDRREIVNALFVGVHNVFKLSGLLSWVTILHSVSTRNPDQPHLHFPSFALPVDSASHRWAGYLDREQFAKRKRSFLAFWNHELSKVCVRFGLQEIESKNIYLSYYTDLGKLAKKLHYEMRPPLQDAFVHSKQSREKTLAAMRLALSFLYPPGTKIALRRIRGGGQFGPRALRSFFDGLGLQKESIPDPGWQSMGKAVLLEDYPGRFVFLVLSTGERVSVSSVSLSAHGCSFRWAKKQ